MGPTPMPGVSDFRAWDNRLLKGYSPGVLNINVPAHVLEVLWINYVFMSKAVRFR